MPQSRATGKSLLSALLWALSLAALCIPLTAAAPQGETAVSWTRTLPGTGAWFLAAVALGLGYRALGGVNRGYARARLWLSALFLAGVATLGESFAQTGTAELLMANVLQAALYFLGRAPAYYMGMVLLTDALSQPCAPRDTPRPQTDGGESPEASGARFGNRLNRTGGAEATRGSAWVDPNGAGSRLGMLEYNRPDSPLGAAQPDRSAGQPGTADARNGAFAWGQANRSQPLPSRDVGNSETSARRQRNARTSQGGLAAATVSAERGRGAAIGRADPAYRLAPAGTEPAIAGRVQPAMPTWASMLLLLLCWLPYLYAIWPGTVSNDSITQIAEIFGRKPLSNGNPVFQTGLVWVALSLGKGIFHSADAAVLIYTGAQALLMAWLLGYSLTRIAETRAPRWLVWLATAFYALCPVFPIFAFCMGKDTSFAMAVLWLTLMAWRAVQSKWPPMRTVVGLCLSAVLCALLRNAGAVLAGVTLAALLIRGMLKGTRQWRAPLMALALLGAAMFALYGAVLPTLEAAPTPETENWSVPLQQVARAVASESLTAEESAAIDAAMPLAQVQAAYNGELSDPVKALWRDGVTEAQKAAFFRTWAGLGLKYPATYLSATFHNSYGYLLPGYVSTIKPTFLLGMEGRTTLIDGAFDFTVNPKANELKTRLQSLFQYAPFRLLTAPGAYGAITLFVLAAILSMRKRGNALCMLPALFTLIGCLFSAVNGYYRYAMPLYFTAPVALALLAQAARSGLRLRRGEMPAPEIRAVS